MNNISSFSHKTHRSLDKDHQKSAAIVQLQYVNDQKEGIQRHKKGTQFTYSYKGKSLRDKDELVRIRKLAIPPSWVKVWICPSASGHIQATGIDLHGRKQYRYHTDWNKVRNETKFHRLLEFGKALPLLRKKLQKDLGSKELTEEKVVATAIRLMEETCIRVGNNGYEKLYGSYGLTTLKDQHVTIQQDKAIFCFIGKKGIKQRVSLRNKKLASIVKQCRDIPGKELFQYYDRNGDRKSIDSGLVNSYIKEGTKGDFSAKDFRTWAASLEALQCFKLTGEATGDKEIKKNIVSVLDEVSSKLGNTRSVCRKYYVHPLLLHLYEENKLVSSLQQVNEKEKTAERKGLSHNEEVLMKILKQYR